MNSGARWPTCDLCARARCPSPAASHPCSLPGPRGLNVRTSLLGNARTSAANAAAAGCRRRDVVPASRACAKARSATAPRPDSGSRPESTCTAWPPRRPGCAAGVSRRLRVAQTALRPRDPRQGAALGPGGPRDEARRESWLRKIENVAAFASARPADGGTGAVYVLLAPARPRPDLLKPTSTRDPSSHVAVARESLFAALGRVPGIAQSTRAARRSRMCHAAT